MALDTRIIQNFPFPIGSDARVVVAGYVGSISHNTYVPKDDPDSIDDVDILGAVLAPVERIIGLDSWDHWVWQHEELDVTMFSLQKLVGLWLKSNPNSLALLWLRPEHYIALSDEFERFREIRGSFVSKQAHKAFTGYARDQLLQMEKNQYRGYMGTKRKELVDRYGYDVKSAAHAVRLLRMGIEYLRDGQLNVYRTDDAEELRSIKRGEWSFEQLRSYATELSKASEEVAEASLLPEYPDRNRVATVLVEVTQDWICETRQ